MFVYIHAYMYTVIHTYSTCCITFYAFIHVYIRTYVCTLIYKAIYCSVRYYTMLDFPTLSGYTRLYKTTPETTPDYTRLTRLF